MSSVTESVESIHSLEAEVVVGLEVVLASLKKFGVADLFKVSKVSLAEAERLVKSGKTEPKVEKEKKPMPKQLRKPTEWVAYVLRYSLANGWPAFSAVNTKTHEIVEYRASGQNEHGEHVYPGGKKMILTHAMSLSKKYWTPKENDGLREDLYREFEAWYAAQLAAEPVEEAARAESPKAPMVRKTAEEKEAEKEAKAKQKEDEKLAKAALKEKAKLEKAPAKGKKAAAAAAAAPVAAPAAAVAAPMAGGLKPGPKKKAAPAAAVEEWICPTDGNVYPWPYKSKDYFRDFENQVWEKAEDGGLGKWAGIFIRAENRIDESAADPFADEEEVNAE
jgi:hypothetical protein